MTKKILIVDDEPSIRFGLSRALQKICDFRGEIKTVENGKDAIKEIRLCHYDICFLDIKLPDINGIEVMKKIKEISPKTDVAIMTAHGISEDTESTIQDLASLFLIKPFDLFYVKAFVKRVLEGGRESRGAKV